MAGKEESISKEVMTTIIGGVAITLVFIVTGAWAQSDFGFLRSLAPYTLWLGIALLIVYQFLFVTNSRIAKTLKGELASQVGLTVLIGYCLLSSSIDAATVLNRVFGVDASAFPNALRVITFVQMFLMGKPIFWLLFTWSVIAFFYFLLGGGSGKSWRAWMFAMSGMAVSGTALIFIYFLLGPTQLDQRAYILTRATDFYSNVNCPGVKIAGSAVFLGPEQRRVLVDNTIIPELSWIQAITVKDEKFKQVRHPSSFPIYNCKENNG